ncbi:MAG: hypothetical protein NT010_03990 [Proteobacteria bacterium]|nr:hypothetical protein [Pseudomonadota bacterium]
MVDDIVSSEEQLITEIRKNAQYIEFYNSRFKNKIEREQQTWALIETNKGKYSTELLKTIFRLVDYEKGKGFWFGTMLNSNIPKILKNTPIEQLIKFIDYVCFSGDAPSIIMDRCVNGDMHIKHARQGLVSILLYLSDPSMHAIWVNATNKGLVVLAGNRVFSFEGFGAQYHDFSNRALEFCRHYSFDPRELDFVLWLIGKKVTYEKDHFAIGKGFKNFPLKKMVNTNTIKDNNIIESANETTMSIGKDNVHFSNIYGDFINFRGLQHAPVNEQGVVFLFGMICRELGYVVESVKSGFPDCEAKRNVKTNMWQRVRIEFEYQAKSFKNHGHDSKGCDLVVCWENDWPECPIEVLELRTVLKRLPSEVGK